MVSTTTQYPPRVTIFMIQFAINPVRTGFGITKLRSHLLRIAVLTPKDFAASRCFKRSFVRRKRRAMGMPRFLQGTVRERHECCGAKKATSPARFVGICEEKGIRAGFL